MKELIQMQMFEFHVPSFLYFRVGVRKKISRDACVVDVALGGLSTSTVLFKDVTAAPSGWLEAQLTQNLENISL